MQTVEVFLLGFFFGGISEYLLSLLFEFLERKPLRITHRFNIAKKVSLVSLPIWGLIALLFLKGSVSYVNVFMVSAVVGTVLEGMLGKFVKVFFGIKLWTYQQGTIGNFTSLYSLPYWGAAGIVFATIGKMLGI